MTIKQMEQFFDRPITELRNAFVRHHLAQENVFGRSDIEAWLANERKADQPDRSRRANAAFEERGYWDTILQRRLPALTARCGFSTMAECATPLAVPPPEREHPFAGRPFEPLLRRFYEQPEKSAPLEIYYGYQYGALIVTTDVTGQRCQYTARVRTLTAHETTEHPHLALEPTAVGQPRHTLFTCDILFAEWLYGRRQRHDARRFLCDALAAEILDEIRRAEGDFDAAVAVSADGTEIVKADWVVVVNAAQTLNLSADVNALLFPGAAFRERKILLGTTRRTISVNEPLDGRTTHLAAHCRLLSCADVMSRGLDCVVIECRNGWTKPNIPERIFAVRRSCCPSLLPEGGVMLSEPPTSGASCRIH